MFPSLLKFIHSKYKLALSWQYNYVEFTLKYKCRYQLTLNTYISIGFYKYFCYKETLITIFLICLYTCAYINPFVLVLVFFLEFAFLVCIRCISYGLLMWENVRLVYIYYDTSKCMIKKRNPRLKPLLNMFLRMYFVFFRKKNNNV